MERLQRPPLVKDAHGPVSRETEERLLTLCRLILEWNTHIRLTAAPTIDALMADHVRPSLDLLTHMPAAAQSAADLGSGQGLPGLVLALARPARMILVEADRRKAAFLRHATMRLGLSCDVVCARIEATPPLRVDFVTARALGPCAALVRYGTRHCASRGVCAFPKGPEVFVEFAQVPSATARRWAVVPARQGHVLLSGPRSG